MLTTSLPRQEKRTGKTFSSTFLLSFRWETSAWRTGSTSWISECQTLTQRIGQKSKRSRKWSPRTDSQKASLSPARRPQGVWYMKSLSIFLTQSNISLSISKFGEVVKFGRNWWNFAGILKGQNSDVCFFILMSVVWFLFSDFWILIDLSQELEQVDLMNSVTRFKPSLHYALSP